MRKELLRTSVGISIILIHSVCFIIIFYFKDDFLSPEQKLSISLLFMPITAAYVVAVIKSAIDRAAVNDKGRVNFNYALIIVSFTRITLGGLLWTVLNLRGAQESDRQTIQLFEIAFGVGFGLIASDLFGKIEKIGNHS